MSEATIDLIYVEYRNQVREMSCAVVGGDKDKLIGPVPFKNSVGALAPSLQAHLPERFPDVKAAENFLTFTHFRNISVRHNSAGQDYPVKIDADK
jgi:hypothetical protein